MTLPHYWLLICHLGLLVGKAADLRLDLALVELLQHLGGVLGNFRAAHRRSDIVAAHVASVIPFIAPFVSFVTLLRLLGPGNHH